jgi:hypothetical protein
MRSSALSRRAADVERLANERWDVLIVGGGIVGAGALLDVFGLRMDELSRDFVAAVVERHPRHDFKRYGWAKFKTEGGANPHGRAHWLNRYALVHPLWAIAPFKG